MIHVEKFMVIPYEEAKKDVQTTKTPDIKITEIIQNANINQKIK